MNSSHWELLRCILSRPRLRTFLRLLLPYAPPACKGWKPWEEEAADKRRLGSWVTMWKLPPVRNTRIVKCLGSQPRQLHLSNILSLWTLTGFLTYWEVRLDASESSFWYRFSGTFLLKFINYCTWRLCCQIGSFNSVQFSSVSRVWLFATPWLVKLKTTGSEKLVSSSGSSTSLL